MPLLGIFFLLLWPWLGLVFWKVIVGISYGELKSFGMIL